MNNKDTFILSLTIFLTVIAWTIADIIHTTTRELDVGVKSLQQIRSYQLDKSIFDIIESKNP